MLHKLNLVHNNLLIIRIVIFKPYSILYYLCFISIHYKRTLMKTYHLNGNTHFYITSCLVNKYMKPMYSFIDQS